MKREKTHDDYYYLNDFGTIAIESRNKFHFSFIFSIFI